MNVYLYDGTFDGFLTAVFYSFADKNEIDITRKNHYQPNLLGTPLEIATENDKASRVSKSICQKLSWNTYKRVYYLYLSELPDCDYLAYRYLKACYRYGANVYLAKDDPLIH